ncbi:MAG: hypothetical protein WBD99_08330 [Thermodesulfobacteriota bacterium]
MAQSFKCKEPGCEEQIVYEYDPVVGAVEMATPVESNEVEVEVYLTCGNDHTHKYKVRK